MLQDILVVRVAGAVQVHHHVFRAGDDVLGDAHTEATAPHIGDRLCRDGKVSNPADRMACMNRMVFFLLSQKCCWGAAVLHELFTHDDKSGQPADILWAHKPEQTGLE